ncbi:MAG: CHASE2 domain-containing protein [Burkholderiaceae bacterium]
MNAWAGLFGKAFLYQRGRAVALVLLMLYAALIVSSDLSPLPAAEPFGRSLALIGAPAAAVRQLLFDGYQRILPRVREAQPVTVVTIDERSLKLVGQWPWPRNKLAVLVDAIASYQPVAIGLDMYLPEPDQTSPEEVAKRLGVENAYLAQELSRLPSYDLRLAHALEAAPTVLGAAGFEFQTLSTTAGMRIAPVKLQGADPLPYLHRYPFVLASLPQLQVAARGQGLISIEETTVVRRIPLVAAVGEFVVPSLAMEMLRVASGSPAVEVTTDGHGIRAVEVAELNVPTQSGGDVWLHFAPESQGVPRNFSAVDVLNGKIAADVFASKLVLIGLTGLGFIDQRATPLGQRMPGIEIQAQLLESMLGGRLLLRPWWMKWVELALLLGVGLAMIWRVPVALRRFGRAATRKRQHAGWWVTGVCVLVLGVGLWLFWGRGWLFDGGSLSIGYALILASLVSSSTLEMERDNRRLATERQLLREEAARFAGEMEVARRIQLGSLPNAKRAFPGERRFTIDALIEPAREVGGDLYDFFMIDARHLYFLIGDVSGKGVPASLFMAVTKALTRSFAARLPGGPADILSAANSDLSRENVETLFVTLLLGVLDVDSGMLELVNAGHDAPWRLGADGALEQLVAPDSVRGPPLCVLEDFDYQVQRIALRPGDRLCMVTDGITEATNAADELYGGARLHDALARMGADPSAEDITRLVREDVGTFVAGAEASDDLAILVLHWVGPAPAPA